MALAPTYAFVDLGARQGDTIRWFLKASQFKAQRPVALWAWEVEPRNLVALNGTLRQMRAGLQKLNSTVALINEAAWTEDGEKSFIRDTRARLDATVPGGIRAKLVGGSLMKNPFNNASATVRVRTTDFSAWLMANTRASDHVTVKMDIEGAEFAVLNKMVADGSIHRVRTLIVEAHEWFFPVAEGGLATQPEPKYTGSSRIWKDLSRKIHMASPKTKVTLWH